jgi:hypothetical protein
MQFTHNTSLARDRLLAVHLDYLRHADPNFQRWWSKLSPSVREDRRTRLGELSRLALQLPSEYDGCYSIAFKRYVDTVLQRGAAVPDKHFDIQIPPAAWLAAVRTRSLNRETCCRVMNRINKVVCVARKELVGAYGGLKPPNSIDQKIAAYESRMHSLDLWDLIRVRVVTKSVIDAIGIATAVRAEYDGDIVRFRNYYARPRTETDLYRAIHLTVREHSRVVEVQIMTGFREVVCEVDHSVAFKQSLRPLSKLHVAWLRRLSLASNVRDAAGLERDILLSFHL